jgi:hypothetical protein
MSFNILKQHYHTYRQGSQAWLVRARSGLSYGTPAERDMGIEGFGVTIEGGGGGKGGSKP